MRDGDEEIGGKHIDPVSIQLLGEKGESAKLIGVGRKMLGNLKARVVEGSSKQTLSGTYRYEASLDELTRWGRPVLGKLNPLQLYENPEDIPYEVTVRWEIQAKTMMSGRQTDIDKLKITTEVGYNLAKGEHTQKEPALEEPEKREEPTAWSGKRVIGYIVQGFIDYEDPFRKNHAFTVTTPSGLVIKNDYENLEVLEPNIPYDGFPYFGTKQRPVQRWLSYSDDTGDVYENPDLEYLVVRDMPGSVKYTLGGPQYFEALPDAPSPPVIGTLWPADTFSATWQQIYTDRSGNTVYLASTGVNTASYFDFWGYYVGSTPVGTFLYWTPGINAQYAAFANGAAEAEMAYLADFYKDYDYHSYQYKYSAENMWPIVQHTKAHGFITGSGFIMPEYMHFEFTDRQIGNGEAAVFMLPSRGKLQYTMADSVDAAGKAISFDNTYSSAVGTSSGATWDNVPTPSFTRPIHDNLTVHSTRTYFVSEPFGIPVHVENGFHTVTGEKGSGYYKVYFLIQNVDANIGGEGGESLVDTAEFFHITLLDITPDTVLKIFVGDLPQGTPYIIHRTN